MSSGNTRGALRFVFLLGVVSLLADMTYESARSLTGPYLAFLGASAAAVGFIAGLGEFIGYGLRIVAGLISDKTGRYWAVTIAGYAINLLAVPALALAGRWEIAAGLIMAERLGKALRTPARDAMLSHAASSLGRGWAFGLHEALDQMGAMLGPLIVAGVLAAKGEYPITFAVLAIPAGLALAVLVATRLTYPHPQKLEAGFRLEGTRALPPVFWLYAAAAGALGMGFVDYPLAAFHLHSAQLIADPWIPVIYAGAMGVDALTALFLGRLYDRKGLPVLAAAIALSAASAPLIFLAGLQSLLVGMFFWAVGMGAQESILRAVVAELVPGGRRATAYGIFNAVFGFAWFGGSAIMGWLYDLSLPALAAFSAALQLSSVPLLLLLQRRRRQEPKPTIPS